VGIESGFALSSWGKPTRLYISGLVLTITFLIDDTSMSCFFESAIMESRAE